MCTQPVQIDTKGICLLCIGNSDNGSSSPKPSTGFKMLIRYLNIELSPSLRLRPPLPSGRGTMDVDLAVSLCSRCSSLLRHFLQLYQEFEMIHMELDHCVWKLHQVIKEGLNKDGDHTKNGTRTSNASKIRKEVLGKCALRLSSSTPRIIIKDAADGVMNLNVRKAQSFKCPICERGFRYRNSLQRHHREVHEERPKIKCNACEEEFRRPETLRRHKEGGRCGKRKPREAAFWRTCPHCDWKGSNKISNFKGHAIACAKRRAAEARAILNSSEMYEVLPSSTSPLMATKSTDLPLQVDTDQELERGKAKLSAHNSKPTKVISVYTGNCRVLSSGKIRCSKCGKVFNHNLYFRIHYHLVHRKPFVADKRKRRAFCCVYCGKVYSRQDSLNAHVVTAHTLIMFKDRLPPETSEEELEKAIQTLARQEKTAETESEEVDISCASIWGLSTCEQKFSSNSSHRRHVFQSHLDQVVLHVENLRRNVIKTEVECDAGIQIKETFSLSSDPPLNSGVPLNYTKKN